MIADAIKYFKDSLPSEVKLVAVSKYRSKEELLEAYEAGQRIFAENRPVEFQNKATSLPQDIEWHFIGHLQTNKLNMVLPYVSLIQSIDSVHLLDAVERWCESRNMVREVLMEVHVAREESKQGFSEDEMLDLFGCSQEQPEKISRYPHIVFRGLMAMASNSDDTSLVDSDFARAEKLFNTIRCKRPDLHNFTELSIGMSGDWQIALEHGATMVRIGSAIFKSLKKSPSII